MNVVHYEMEYGELPLDVTIASTYSGKSSEEQVELC
jgi:hypothetical protein